MKTIKLMKMIELIESMKAITDNGDSLAPFFWGV